jgi:hypothetical protein
MFGKHGLFCCKDLLDGLCSFDEFLHHGIKLGQVVFALLDFGNQLLLLLELLLTALLQLQPNLVFVIYAHCRKVVLGEILVLGKFSEEFFDRDERQLHVLVASFTSVPWHIPSDVDKD